MQLETIAASVRSRTPWEAIDLGFAMVRRWWVNIYTPLVMLILVIITPLLFALPDGYFWLSLVIPWWLKPLYHRLILHIISHQLFGSTLTWSAALKQLPDLMLHTGLLSELTWRRFSFSRGFNLPIWQLEKLRGKSRSQRQQLLISQVHGPAIWLNIAITGFQFILILSFFMLIWLFVPEYYADDLFDRIFFYQFESTAYALKAVMLISFVVIMVFLEPFYIAASFALYINRRTQLEAWDVELDFRKMAKRIEGLSDKLGIVLCGFCAALLAVSVFPNPSFADVNKEAAANITTFNEALYEPRREASESATAIQEVMQNEYLRQETSVKRWRFKDNTDELEDDRPDWLQSLTILVSVIIEFGLWIAIAMCIAALYIYRKKWLPLLVRTPDEMTPLRPDILFGMDVRHDSLPNDVVAEARQLWQQNKAREALSLLYRCALAQLLNHNNLPLKHSHTEGDILKLSKTTMTEQQYHYLETLTRHWVKIAYAHEAPCESDMMCLLGNWHNEFAANQESPS